MGIQIWENKSSVYVVPGRLDCMHLITAYIKKKVKLLFEVNNINKNYNYKASILSKRQFRRFSERMRLEMY